MPEKKISFRNQIILATRFLEKAPESFEREDYTVFDLMLSINELEEEIRQLKQFVKSQYSQQNA